MFKKIALIFSLFLITSVFADTPPQIINKLCSTHQWFSQIQPGPNNINCTQPSYSDLLNPLSFSDSLVNTAGNITLRGDSAAPGASKYYGTNGSSTLGFFNLPSSIVWGSITGTLSNQTDLQTALNAKQALLTPGSISTSTSGVSVGSGTSSTIGPNVTVNVQTASGSQPGLLSSTDWTTFNSKQSGPLTGDVTTSGAVSTLAATAVTPGSYTNSSITVDSKGRLTAASSGSVVSSVTASVPLFSSGGATPNITIQSASGVQAGALTSADWNTFNGKQDAGNYLTALTGDVTASGPGSAASTIAANAVTNAKAAQMATHTIKGNNTVSTADASDLSVAQVNTLLGDVTSVSGTAPIVSSGGATPAISCNVASGSQAGCLASADFTTFNSKQAGPLTGDVTTIGAAATLADTAVTPGNYSSSNITVDSKGRVTSASNGSVSIGETITSGTAGSVLIVNPSATISQDNANFSYSVTNHQLTLGVAPIVTPFSSTGLVHNSSGGLLSSSLLVDADVSASSAIARSKLASGTNNNLVVNGVAGVMQDLGSVGTTTTVLHGNASGLPSFGSIVGADLPNPSASTLGGVQSAAAVSHQWINAISTSGVPALSQPAFSDISGTATLAQLPSIANNTILGNNSSTGAPIALTVAQTNAILPVFTSLLNGLAPLSGGGSTNYLRADGTWAVPPGSTSGTVTSASVVSANGFAGTVATASTTPAITLTTSITGVLKGNSTAISAATAGTDYSAGTSALGTGILKSTTTTGALTIAIAGDFPTLNQNTSGTAAGLSATLVETSGGTNQSTYTLGDTLYSSAANTLSKLAGNTTSTKKFLSQTGTGSVSAAPAWSTFTAPTITKLTSTGTQTGWLFTISTSSTVAVGDTYTNNSNTYTVQGALTAQSGQVLFMSGTGATSGTTLARSAGAGTSSITFSAKLATATYTTPAGAISLSIKAVGAGGGGSSSGTSGGTGGNAGTSTFFGANVITLGGGGGGTYQGAGGTGGTAGTLNSPALGTAFNGGSGEASFNSSTASASAVAGGNGGQTPLGGAGAGGAVNAGGLAAVANSGSGGGGGGTNSGVATDSRGSGGGAAAFYSGILPAPGASFPYLIGSKGTGGGNSGANGQAGADGSDGYIEIIETYQ